MESMGESSQRSRHTRGILRGDLLNGERESEGESDGEGEDISDRDETISDKDEMRVLLLLITEDVLSAVPHLQQIKDCLSLVKYDGIVDIYCTLNGASCILLPCKQIGNLLPLPQSHRNG